MINTSENATMIVSHVMRPRTIAPWATTAYATAATNGAAPTTKGLPFAGVDAGALGTGARDSVALQGAPPRENPR